MRWLQLPSAYTQIQTERARRHFGRWLKLVTPAYHWDWAHLALTRKYLDRVTRGELDRLMIFEPPRHGKALAIDTPIPTPEGWKAIGDIRPGDRVFSDTGKPCNVVAISPIWRDRPVYRVTTDDGSDVLADAEHEWVVRLCRKRKVFSTRTTEWLASRTSPRRPMVRRPGALALPDAVLPIHPYVLGLWLGDGCTQHVTITAGDEDYRWTRAEVGRCGYTTSDRSTDNTFGILETHVPFCEAGVIGNKHIPDVYMRASEQQRRALLQGLIDSDGYVAPDGQVEFCSTNQALAVSARELVHSLGYKASLVLGRATLNGQDFGPKYRVMFYMDRAARMPRKAMLCRDAEKTPDYYISVEPAGKADTMCIQVDSPSHMFLCGPSMMPTHNSEMVTVRYPVWRLERDPEMRVIIGAYSQTLANRFSRRSRGIARERFDLNNERAAAEEWETMAGGGFRAAGVGAGVTGMGGQLIVIDDPVKNREEANSEAYRERCWHWYTDDLYTRLEPGGAIVLIMTRWHEDDLAGRILASEEADQWTVLSLPALAEENDPLGRVPGAALCPERYDTEALARIREVLGHSFYALYQQRPQPLEGGMFKRGWFEIADAPPYQLARVVRYWDKAGTADGGAYTAGVLMGYQNGVFWVLDVVRGQWTAGTREQTIKTTAHLDRQRWGEVYQVWVEQEPGSGGKESAENTIRNLAGYTVHADRPTGDKALRAEPYAAQAEAGNVRIVSAPWNAAYINEHTSFPTGAYADQVDASSGAFNKLTIRQYGKPGLVRYA